jgi:hypothetical protein
MITGRGDSLQPPINNPSYAANCLSLVAITRVRWRSKGHSLSLLKFPYNRLSGPAPRNHGPIDRGKALILAADKQPMVHPHRLTEGIGGGGLLVRQGFLDAAEAERSPAAYLRTEPPGKLRPALTFQVKVSYPRIAHHGDLDSWRKPWRAYYLGHLLKLLYRCCRFSGLPPWPGASTQNLRREFRPE